DAVITSTISGGTAPFTYEVSIDGGAYSSLGAAPSPFTYSTSDAGTYRFRVTDATGCQAVSNVITVSPLTSPTATTTIVNASCNGSRDGFVQNISWGYVGPYTFRFKESDFSTTSLNLGLTAGN